MNPNNVCMGGLVSPLSLVDGFFAGQSDVSLLRVSCCRLFLLTLNFSSAFCCCSRGVLPGKDLHPLFESRIVVCFCGHLR